MHFVGQDEHSLKWTAANSKMFLTSCSCMKFHFCAWKNFKSPTEKSDYIGSWRIRKRRNTKVLSENFDVIGICTKWARVTNGNSRLNRIFPLLVLFIGNGERALSLPLLVCVIWYGWRNIFSGRVTVHFPLLHMTELKLPYQADLVSIWNFLNSSLLNRLLIQRNVTMKTE